MTKSRFVGALIISLVVIVLPRIGTACEVISTDIRPSDDELRRYYHDEFKGAIFVGKVIAEEPDQIPQTRGWEPVTRVEVEVQQLWAGERHSKISIFTGTGEGDCHMIFKIGLSYGFTVRLEDGWLRSTFPNTTEFKDSKEQDKWVAYFDRILGPPTVFPLKETQF